mmetsp:Transcript_67475/g.158313  ORF Transcript_67475/g.158313 Transcript_67475/m.158313 type:complete len:246 (+) Transcript_67475:1803-2540(+)
MNHILVAFVESTAKLHIHFAQSGLHFGEGCNQRRPETIQFLPGHGNVESGTRLVCAEDLPDDPNSLQWSGILPGHGDEDGAPNITNSLGESCRPPFHRIRISNVLVDHECVHQKVCCNTTAFPCIPSFKCIQKSGVVIPPSMRDKVMCHRDEAGLLLLVLQVLLEADLGIRQKLISVLRRHTQLATLEHGQWLDDVEAQPTYGKVFRADLGLVCVAKLLHEGQSHPMQWANRKIIDCTLLLNLRG